MASEIEKRTGNYVPTIMGVSSVDLISPTRIAVNPTTHAVLIDGTSLYTGLDVRYLRISQNLSDVAVANTALNNILPSQTSNSGKFLTTNGTNTSWGTVSASPGGSDTNVQFNDATSFGGSDQFKFNKTIGKVTIAPAPITVGTPSAVAITVEYDPGYAYRVDITFNAKVYAYKLDAIGNKVFSSSFATTTDVFGNSAIERYRVKFDITPVTGADGYRFLMYQTDKGYVYDYYVDVVAVDIPLYDDDNQSYTTPVVITPTTGAGQALKADGYVGIDSTASGFSPTEALDVKQNVRYRGHLAGGGATIDDSTTTLSIGMNYLETITDPGKIFMQGQQTILTISPSSANASAVAIGYTLQVINDTNAISSMYGASFNVTDKIGVSSTVGAAFQVSSTSASSASTSFLMGLDLAASKNSTGNTNNVYGARFTVAVPNSGNVIEAAGGKFQMSSTSANADANITSLIGGYFNAVLTGRGSNTLIAAGKFQIDLQKDFAVAGTAADVALFYGVWNRSTISPTNCYGIYLPNITGGTNNWSIYSQGGQSSHLGNFRIGSNSAPTAKLHLDAGTTSASTAPIKLTSGTLMTTAEIGAKEYNGNHYQTTAGIVRYSEGGTIKDFTTDTTVGGTEADIYTFTTIANTLNANADKLISMWSGNFVTVGTELTQLKVYFAGTAIWDSTGVAPTTGTTSWRVYCEIIRVSSTVVRYTISLNTTGASGYVYAVSGELTGLTLSSTNILKITGASSGVGSGSGDIVGKMGYIQFEGAV